MQLLPRWMELSKAETATNEFSELQILVELSKGVARWQDPRCLGYWERNRKGRISPLLRSSNGWAERESESRE